MCPVRAIFPGSVTDYVVKTIHIFEGEEEGACNRFEMDNDVNVFRTRD